MDLTVYHGWKIYTHVGKPTPNKIPHLKSKLRGWFGQGEWLFENGYRTMIYNENVDSPIEVVFSEVTTEEEKSRGLTKYGIVIKSDSFDLRNTYPHKQLCKEVLRKIPWQKQGFLLIDNEWIPIPQGRILRKKK